MEEKLIKIASKTEGVFIQLPASSPLAIWASTYFEATDGSFYEQFDDVPKEKLPVTVTGDLIIELPHNRYVFRNTPWAFSKSVSLMKLLMNYDRTEDLLIVMEEVVPEDDCFAKGGFISEKMYG